MRDPLSQILIDQGDLTEDQRKAAELEASVTHERLSAILVRNGFVSQAIIFDTILKTSPEAIYHEATYLDNVPPGLLIDTRTMIVFGGYERLILATLSNQERVRAEFEKIMPGFLIEFTKVNPHRLDTYLTEVKRKGAQGNRKLIWEELFDEATKLGASDVHILPRYKSYTVELRVDGVLRLHHEGTLDEYIALVSRVKDMAKMDMAEKRKPQDGSFSATYNGRVINFRVATVPTVDGERMVVRILDPDSINLSLDSLGITELATWKRIIGMPDGLCLICGPTGSGKSTTLAATAREMNFLERAIYSIEDPVENRIPYAAQVNTNEAVGLDFSSAIRSFMRADPDVIIVGEVRDIDTARVAIKAAETGHLVLATLHTSSITHSVSRLRDIGVEPYELKPLLRGVMVQRLMRVFCKHCGGKGCERCSGTGYKGRDAVTEIARIRNEADADRIFEGKVSWQTIQQDAKAKVEAGRTSPEELKRVFGIGIDEIEDGVTEGAK